MSDGTKQSKKALFIGALILAFLSVALYNFLTPYLSDDLFYLAQLREAHSLTDLLRFNAREYITNNCRFVDQFLMRLMFWFGNKAYSNIINSAVFAGLILLIFQNVRTKKKYDTFVILMIFLLLWKYLVDFGDTVLWVAGTAGYLYGIMWILGFVTYYRSLLNRPQLKRPVLSVILLILLGIAAGMANENTSGGGFLLILIFTLNKIANNRQCGIKIRDSIRPYMIAGHLSILLGLGLLVLGPGAQSRKEVVDRGTYEGITAIASHIYKITLSIRELFLSLLVMIAALILILAIQKKWKSFSDLRNDPGIVFLTVAVIVCYVMAVIEPASNRVYFGASVFFIIAFVNLLQEMDLSEQYCRFLKYLPVTLLALWFVFAYLENAVNLARILREENERCAILEQAADENDFYQDVVVPQYRPDWENPYTTAYKNDMTNDATYWINTFYEGYYGINGINAVPYEEWEKEWKDK
ncbi:MAG: DUF6056 family protein [Lachnospiraceae bacterium]|nr:DUF6056 family protein [Lachnospiraceae bacterium]